MSDVTKLYHWTNIILNPSLLLFIFVSQSDYAMMAAMGWVNAVLEENPQA